MLHSLLLLLICSSLISLIAEADNLHDQVFGKDAIRLEPLKTLKLLVQISELRSDNNIESLIDASELDSRSCNQQSYLKLSELTINNLQHKVNILPYLSYCEQKLIDRCEKSFDKHLLDPLEGLTKEEKFRGLEFEDALKKSHLGPEREMIAEAVLEFMKRKACPVLNVPISRRSYNSRLNIQLMHLCKTVQSNLLQVNGEQRKPVEPEWLRVLRSCEEVERNYAFVEANTFEALKKCSK